MAWFWCRGYRCITIDFGRGIRYTDKRNSSIFGGLTTRRSSRKIYLGYDKIKIGKWS